MGVYQFRKADSSTDPRLFQGEKILNVNEDYAMSEDLNLWTPTVFGQLWTLFGEPSTSSENLEDGFNYNLIAEDGGGSAIYLYAYNGSSGPAIGGDSQISGAVAAAEELEKLINESSLSDCEYHGYYMDGPSEVTMGVKDGVAFWNEEPLELTDDEWEELEQRVMGW